MATIKKLEETSYHSKLDIQRLQAELASEEERHRELDIENKVMSFCRFASSTFSSY